MAIDMNRIREELTKVGIAINDIYDLVNTGMPYPAAVPVLLDLLQEGIDNVEIEEGVIRALTVKEAIGKASPILLDEYNKISKDKMLLRWTIGNAIYITITEDDVERILSIVQDKENGMSRQMFVAALGKVKSGKAEHILIELLNDDEVAIQALESLGRMKAKNAKEKISMLIKHPNALIRKEAQKALTKIS